MEFIRNIISIISPNSVEDSKFSTVCIATTNPVYLIFGDSSSKPEYVIRSADNDDSVRAHNVCRALFEVSGSLVPEPLGIFEYKKSLYSVQKGVAGTPWFQIAKAYPDMNGWHDIRTKSLNTLHKLHQTSAEISVKEVIDLPPATQLNQAFLRFCEIEGKPSEQMKSLFNESAISLKSINTATNVPQHGDFCLNNLLIDKKNVTVIDFEDFGITSMPLYDAFTLALSLASSAPKQLKISEADELSYCISEEVKNLELDIKAIRALFFYHLILRLGDWSLGEKRDNYRKFLLSTLDRFISDPDYYLPDQSHPKKSIDSN